MRPIITAILPSVILVTLFVGGVKGSMKLVELREVPQSETTVKVSPRPTVRPRISPTPTPTPIQTVKKKEPQVECIGPDGVHFNTSLKECDNFNQSWNKVDQQPIQNSGGSALIDCYTKYGLERLTPNGCELAKQTDAFYEEQYRLIDQTRNDFYIPPPPVDETYVPQYPTPDIPTQPFSSIGPSVPVNPPECYQIGDKTICK